MTRLAPFLWLAYLLVPVEGWGLFPGRPLGPFQALALMAFFWIWWSSAFAPSALRRDPSGPRWGKAFAIFAGAALAAKLVLGMTLLAPRGFDARYYANADFTGPAEAGTEPAARTFTRIDRRLNFGGGADRDLPLYFLNNIKRFNFYLPNEPERGTLPVSATWEGWLHVRRAGLTRFYARNPAHLRQGYGGLGGGVVMSIGDDYSTTISPSATEWIGYARLKLGFQRIRISLSLPRGADRALEAGWTVDGREEPFDARVVFRKPVGRIGLAADWVVRAGSTVLDLLLCGWLTFAVLVGFRDAWRRLTSSPAIRDGIAVAWTIAIVDAFLFARPFFDRMITLSGGDDWLNYESRARDIGINSIWMLDGLPLGQGNPFYQMPFYPYFVAAAHWLLGDSLYGVYLTQRLLVGATAIALWRVTAALFGERIGGAGLVAALVIVYTKVVPWSGILLTELLFVPLVCIWALLLVRIAQGQAPSLWAAAGAGVIGGLATITRSSLLLAWPFVLVLVAVFLGRQNKKQAATVVAVIAVALIAATSLATIRNWVVSRQFVFISSYGAINLYLNNEPPRPIIVPPEHKATYDRFGLDPYTQTVIEFARQMPRAYFGLWTRRGTYALGWFKWFIPARGISVFYMMAAAIGLLGVLLLAARPSWLPRAGPPSLIPLAIGLTHFAVLVVVDSSTYGDRLLLAFYALIVPYLAIVAFGLHRGLWQITGRATGLVIWLALLAVCGWTWMGGASQLNVPLLGTIAMVWGVCLFGIPRLAGPSALIYAALATSLIVWAALRGTVVAEHAARMDLLLVLTAFCSSAILAGVSRLRLPRVPGLRWLGAGSVAVAVVVLHGPATAAPLMIVAGLFAGAIQSVLSPPESTSDLHVWPQ